MEAIDPSSESKSTPAGLPPATEDLQFAQLAVRTHCAIEWPEGHRCLNCAKPHPCEINSWGMSTLSRAGWTAEQIAALDRRAGAWS
jgi:hypothetical protein